MKIISWNVNGLRAILQKGFLNWFKKENPDILCLQEIKLRTGEFQLSFDWPKEYFTFFNFAQKRGYAGVAALSKIKPLIEELKLGFERFDNEGRFLKLTLPGFVLINLYLPHGGRRKENLEYKLKVYDHLLKYLKPLKDQNVILTGDFNVAHQEIDLARPKQNKDNIMFSQKEREKIDGLLKLGFVDAFRKFHKKGGFYTWWPYFADARERNLGWRIDYIFVSRPLTPKITDAFILKEIQGSDHCPIGVELKINSFC